ncbi:MAG: prolipoprotein diacylglyceryl transferase [Candidatus Gracilibacteria bacterium]
MPIFTLNIGLFTLAPTWYGLMYALSFYIFFLILRKQKISEKNIDILLLYTLIGVLLGGRLGYVFFYNFPYYRDHLLEILMPWRGGMSFHGGALGVILAWYYAACRMHIPFLKLSDQLVWIVPIGLFFGRIGNYINGELLGLAGYTGWFAKMVQGVSYFPTPLLEALGEGVLLGGALYWKRNHIRYPGELGVWFLGGYGTVRFIAEFFRDPDLQIGYIFGDWMTLGHILSLAMIAMSLLLHFVLKNKKF